MNSEYLKKLKTTSKKVAFRAYYDYVTDIKVISLLGRWGVRSKSDSVCWQARQQAANLWDPSNHLWWFRVGP